MRTQFRSINFRPDSLDRISRINRVLSEYDGQRLTARQVYYRLVAALDIPNTPTSYKNLTSLLADARYAGLVDWDLIEDRGREPSTPAEWDSSTNSWTWPFRDSDFLDEQRSPTTSSYG